MSAALSGPIHVIGAGGRSGAALCRDLLNRGEAVAGIVRDRARLPPDLADRLTGVRIADLRDPPALRRALDGAAIVVSTAHARHLPAILAATAAPVVALGSTRKFSRWPDAHGSGVIAGEAALKADGRPSVLLHPTMIYGAQGEDNVQRLARLLARIPLVPLPGGGRSLVQPIDQRDVTACMIAAIDLLRSGPATGRAVAGPESLVIAGPDAVPYRDFTALILRHAGLRRRPVLPVPAPLLSACARLTRRLPLSVPEIRPEEIRRLLEDKNFDIAPMRARLGVAPIPLDEGLRTLFSGAAG